MGSWGASAETPETSEAGPFVWRSVVECVELCHLPESYAGGGLVRKKAHKLLVTAVGSEECVQLPPQPGHRLLT